VGIIRTVKSPTRIGVSPDAPFDATVGLVQLANGTVEEASSDGDTGADRFKDIALYQNNEILICGSSEQSASGTVDVFWEIFDQNCGGPGLNIEAGDGEDIAYSAATNSSEIYLAGGFTSSNLAFGQTTLASKGVHDMFLAKIGEIVFVGEAQLPLREIIIYPNPASDRIEISVSGDWDEIFLLEIFSGSGEKVFGSDLKAGTKTTIQTLHFSKGIYIARFTGKEVIHKKFIIN